MKLAVFGATGGTGRLLVEQALAGGHEVNAFARKPVAITIQHERLHVVQGDVLTPACVREAVKGTDAVLCAFGTSNEPNTTVLSEGTQNILVAMEKHGVRRFVCEASLGVGDSRALGGIFFDYMIVPLFMKHKFADKEKQDLLIHQSALDWIIVRATRLTHGPKTGVYRTGLKLRLGPWARIARADVAEFMLKQVSDNTYLRQAPGISY
jgi:putative NADH-flavin reductase